MLSEEWKRHFWDFVFFFVKELLLMIGLVSVVLVTMFACVWTVQSDWNPFVGFMWSVAILLGIMFTIPHVFMSKKRWYTLVGGLIGITYILSIYTYQLVLKESAYMVGPYLDSMMLVAASLFYLGNWIKVLKYGPSFLLPAPGREA